MFGFIIGTVCLIGLIATLRRGRFGYGGGCGQGYGRWGGHGGGWRHGGGWGHCHHGSWEERGGGDVEERHSARSGRGPKQFILRRLFERLDTTPGQEKVIAAAYDEIRDAVHTAKQGWKASRGDVAKAVRSESFDAVHLGEVFGKHDDAIDGVRKAFVGAMQKVHDALDERQRSVLADLIESGPFGGFGGGGFGRGQERWS
ncbi:MAG: hypothetical protein ABI175_18360 [Polyangiales bacterium]